jgi:DNA-binding FrmR family transcriptional regulator
MAKPQTTVYLTDEVQKDLLNRLSRIEGHVRGIRAMIQEHQSCNDLLVQLSAVKSAVNQTLITLLEGHMDVCVKACVHDQDEEQLDELKVALALVLKRS